MYLVCALSDQNGSRHLCPRHSPTAQFETSKLVVKHSFNFNLI